MNECLCLVQDWAQLRLLTYQLQFTSKIVHSLISIAIHVQEQHCSSRHKTLILTHQHSRILIIKLILMGINQQLHYLNFTWDKHIVVSLNIYTSALWQWMGFMEDQVVDLWMFNGKHTLHILLLEHLLINCKLLAVNLRICILMAMPHGHI